MESVQIVAARPEDVPAILGLIKALADYERLSHQVTVTEDDLRAALFVDRPAAEVVLARAGDTVVGFALFLHNFSTFLGRPGLHLEDLFVVPEWRGRGVGRQLLQHLAAIAVQRGCGRMEWTVLEWNDAALGFYERLGAKVLEDWRVCRLTGDDLARVASSGG